MRLPVRSITQLRAGSLPRMSATHIPASSLALGTKMDCDRLVAATSGDLLSLWGTPVTPRTYSLAASGSPAVEMSLETCVAAWLRHVQRSSCMWHANAAAATELHSRPEWVASLLCAYGLSGGCGAGWSDHPATSSWLATQTFSRQGGEAERSLACDTWARHVLRQLHTLLVSASGHNPTIMMMDSLEVVELCAVSLCKSGDEVRSWLSKLLSDGEHRRQSWASRAPMLLHSISHAVDRCRAVDVALCSADEDQQRVDFLFIDVVDAYFGGLRGLLALAVQSLTNSEHDGIAAAEMMTAQWLRAFSLYVDALCAAGNVALAVEAASQFELVRSRSCMANVAPLLVVPRRFWISMTAAVLLPMVTHSTREVGCIANATPNAAVPSVDFVVDQLKHDSDALKQAVQENKYARNTQLPVICGSPIMLAWIVKQVIATGTGGWCAKKVTLLLDIVQSFDVMSLVANGVPGSEFHVVAHPQEGSVEMEAIMSATNHHWRSTTASLLITALTDVVHFCVSRSAASDSDDDYLIRRTVEASAACLMELLTRWASKGTARSSNERNNKKRSWRETGTAKLRSHKMELLRSEVPHEKLVLWMETLLRFGFLDHAVATAVTVLRLDLADIHAWSMELAASLLHASRTMHSPPSDSVWIKEAFRLRYFVFGDRAPESHPRPLETTEPLKSPTTALLVVNTKERLVYPELASFKDTAFWSHFGALQHASRGTSAFREWRQVGSATTSQTL